PFGVASRALGSAAHDRRHEDHAPGRRERDERRERESLAPCECRQAALEFVGIHRRQRTALARRRAKKSESSVPHGSTRMPCVTSVWSWSRGSAGLAITLPQAPVFGPRAP